MNITCAGIVVPYLRDLEKSSLHGWSIHPLQGCLWERECYPHEWIRGALELRLLQNYQNSLELTSINAIQALYGILNFQKSSSATPSGTRQSFDLGSVDFFDTQRYHCKLLQGQTYQRICRIVQCQNQRSSQAVPWYKWHYILLVQIMHFIWLTIILIPTENIYWPLPTGGMVGAILRTPLMLEHKRKGIW